MTHIKRFMIQRPIPGVENESGNGCSFLSNGVYFTVSHTIKKNYNYVLNVIDTFSREPK